ncbi:MAG: Uncharacterised protein [Cyanobium sp. ARS6]|nr:MAG: Uncharacterised protein [Cyanobium sp. ARS6]
MLVIQPREDCPALTGLDESWSGRHSDDADRIHSHGSNLTGLVAIGQAADLEGQAPIDHGGSE